MADSPQDVEPPLKPRGLWAVMGATSETELADSSAEVPPQTVLAGSLPAAIDSPATQPLRGLFDVMQQAGRNEAGSTILTTVDSQGAIPVEPVTETLQSEPSSVNTDFERMTQSEQTQPMPVDWLNGPEVYEMRVIGADVRQGRISIAFGFASIALSFLAIRPEFWMSVPAAVLGFVAIIRASLVLTTQSRQRDREVSLRRMAMVAILLGTTGAFLGPLFTSWGRHWRESTAVAGVPGDSARANPSVNE